jgi:hypothetical protein
MQNIKKSKRDFLMYVICAAAILGKTRDNAALGPIA